MGQCTQRRLIPAQCARWGSMGAACGGSLLLWQIDASSALLKSAAPDHDCVLAHCAQAIDRHTRGMPTRRRSARRPVWPSVAPLCHCEAPLRQRQHPLNFARGWLVGVSVAAAAVLSVGATCSDPQPTETGHVTIRTASTVILSGAYSGCAELRTVVFAAPSQVTTIGVSAFAG